MNDILITSDYGVFTVLAGVCAFFFFLARRTCWKIFDYLPPLLWIYLTPMLLSNAGVIPHSNPVYGTMKVYLIPMFLTIMLLDVNVRAAFSSMGRVVAVMLFGSVGVVVGAVVSYSLFKGLMGPEIWKAFGTLAGSWIGGTGNMAAVAGAVDISKADMGLAVLADNVIYVVWLPLLLTSRNWGKWFNKFTGVTEEHFERMKELAESLGNKSKEVAMHHVLYLVFLGLLVMTAAKVVAPYMPQLEPVFNTSTWTVLLVSTFALLLSQTPARTIPGSQPISMALVYLFVARMGATSSLEGLAQAPWFILAAFLWIVIHGAFCLLGARIFKLDVSSAAICSAANIGGAASAPVVAAFHDERLVPLAVLMALIGYAVGTYLAFGAAQLCSMI
ncbi:DUF819 domain-containing protein [Salidesulfovibrio onnuriiensis]|uniref:DUF819 family protein n=1 Tax=Salidesulfovibrio onnuriiensis TaxID=2583823 RepID=UPI0011C6FD5F|nr:DUF819 family protein [Salidesulfovibrio onnuriiensis]